MNHGDHGDHGDLALHPVIPMQDGDLNFVVDRILDAAFKLHRQYGPGLLENAYQALLMHDLAKYQNFTVEAQKALPLIHENIKIDVAYKLDLLVERSVIVELKACEKIIPIHEAQLLTYMKLSGMRLGLIINFNAKMLKDGIRRLKL